MRLPVSWAVAGKVRSSSQWFVVLKRSINFTVTSMAKPEGGICKGKHSNHKLGPSVYDRLNRRVEMDLLQDVVCEPICAENVT